MQRGEEETATPSSSNGNSKTGFQTNWKVMGTPRQHGPKGLLGPASYKVICSLQGSPAPPFFTAASPIYVLPSLKSQLTDLFFFRIKHYLP